MIVILNLDNATGSGSGSSSSFIEIARKGTSSESDEQKVEEVDDVGGDLAAVGE